MEILQPPQLLVSLQQVMFKTIFTVKPSQVQGVAVWQRLMRKDFSRNNVMAANENDKDEADLFREAIKGANPLKISPKKKEYKAPQKKPKPVPLNFLRDERQALIDSISDHYEPLHDIENGEELFYVKQGHSPDLLKKLRKGYWVVQKSIDLHGMISAEAKAYVIQFIADCKKNNVRCVRIVHGKGFNSKNKEPILKNKLKHWLAQKEEVIAYAQAREHDGGSGAVVVLLSAH